MCYTGSFHAQIRSRQAGTFLGERSPPWKDPTAELINQRACIAQHVVHCRQPVIS
jgi:hypothetical protein